MRFVWRFYRYWDYEIWVNQQKDRLEHEINELHTTINGLESAINDQNMRILDQDTQISMLEERVHNVYSSKSYRVGNALLIKPIHAITTAIRMREK